jgi:cobalt-zinc-cadmium efflux system outer membrane protein
MPKILKSLSPQNRARCLLAILAMVLNPTLAYSKNTAQDEKIAAVVNNEPRLRGPIGNSLSIDQAMDETLMQSPRAASIRLELGIAKSARIRATELPNPSFIIDNGYRAEFTYRYGVSIPIEPPWKLALRLIAAKKQIGLTDLQIAKGLWLLRGDIRRNYTEALLAQERYKTANELCQLYEQLLTMAKVRFDAGDVAELDVQRAELAVERTRINRDLMNGKFTRAKQGLAVLLGRSYDATYSVPKLPDFKLKAEKLDYLPDLETPLPELPVLLSKAMANRLEVKIVDQSIRLNGANLKLAYGNIMPNTTLGIGSSVVNGPPLEIGGSNKNNFHGFFFQSNTPLPLFNFNQGDISLYKARSKQLKGELEAQKNIVEQEVVQAFKAVQIQRERIQQLQNKTLERSKKVAQMSQKSYEIGQTDMSSVLVAQQANLEVRYEYLDAVYAYEIAYTDLEQAIGTTFY